ncbi:MAG: HIRAN domain-containing protein [Amphritea sp.]|nr:HIRAN domain-containing protein [Amphritea sp.]
MKARNIVVAGTGFEGRAKVITKHIRDGMPVHLVRDKHNKYDANAIAVFIVVPVLFGLFGNRVHQIGFVKAGTAKSLAPKMDEGLRLKGVVDSYYAPKGREHPRVSVKIFEDT